MAPTTATWSKTLSSPITVMSPAPEASPAWSTNYADFNEKAKRIAQTMHTHSAVTYLLTPLTTLSRMPIFSFRSAGFFSVSPHNLYIAASSILT